jgi:hypothetical protein
VLFSFMFSSVIIRAVRLDTCHGRIDRKMGSVASEITLGVYVLLNAFFMLPIKADPGVIEVGEELL